LTTKQYPKIQDSKALLQLTLLNFNRYIFKVIKVRKKRRMWEERKKERKKVERE